MVILVHAALAVLAPAVELQEERATHLGLYIGTIDALVRPVAVDFGPAGDVDRALWVAERGDTVTEPGLRALDGVDGSLGGKTTTARTLVRRGVGTLAEPSGLAVSRAGEVWATDSALHSLFRFTADGEHEVVAGMGSGAGELLFPEGVTLLESEDGTLRRVAVADAGNGRVQLFDPGAETWTVLDADDLEWPSAVAFFGDASDGSAASRVAVCDASRHKVVTFALDGSDVQTFSDWGPFPSFVSSPGGIDTTDGLLFVSDTENHRVQAFDPNRDGRLDYRFGVHAIRPGEGAGSFHYPRGIAIDANGNLMALAEPMDGRIQVFGRAEGHVPKEDPTRAGLGSPSAHLGPVAAASGQFLATVSPESHRVTIHDVRGERPVKIAELFGFGRRLGALRGPSGVWLADGGSKLIVADSGTRRLTRATLRVDPDETLRQRPELAIYEDAVRLDALEFPPDQRPDRERPWVAPLPGAVCTYESPNGTRIAVIDRANEVVLLLDEVLDPVRVLSLGPARPTGLVPSPRGGLLVAAAGRAGGHVFEFDATGTLLHEFGTDVLAQPAGLAARADRIWVTEPLRDRVEVFELTDDAAAPPEHVGGFGGRGLGRKRFHGPTDACVLGDGRLIVIDHGNHRGQIFTPDGEFDAGFGSRLYVAPLRAEDE